MGAGSRFDQPLTLIQDGHQVVACGPLRFFGCDVSARVSIDLTQQPKRLRERDVFRPGRGRATADGVFPNTNYSKKRCDEEVGDDEDEWMLTATVQPYPVTSQVSAIAWSGAAFLPTPPGELVVAHGSIVYTRDDGSTHGFTWIGTGDVTDPPNQRLRVR